MRDCDLEQTSFGPAIAHEGTLYAIGTRVPGLADVVLYALDPQNGQTRWSMRLCYGQQEVTMFGRPARWPFTSLPAIAGGQLYLCTNLGGMVAVNLERRVLSWISKYEYMCRPMTSNIWTYYRPVSWFNSPTIYAEAGGDGYVVAAPADSQLMGRVRDGEVALLGELFERHHQRLFHFFLRLARSRQAAEDLVQEVFVRMLKYRHTFRSESEFVPWMFTLARNAATDLYRARPKELPENPDTPEPQADLPHPVVFLHWPGKFMLLDAIRVIGRHRGGGD